MNDPQHSPNPLPSADAPAAAAHKPLDAPATARVRSPAEIAAEIQKSFKQAHESTDSAGALRDLEGFREELQSLIGNKRKKR
jgi:hypothetical protein